MAREPSDMAEPFARGEARHVFGSVAALYAVARPGYPERVYEVLRDRCRLGRHSRVLEIGPGSGQATTRLVEFGAQVVAVEPNEALAEQLRARVTTFAAVDLVVAAFEDADLPPASFDLVTAATAFHWLDPTEALPKVVSLLRRGGWLALWWNVFGDPELPDPFQDATEPLLRNLAPRPSAGMGQNPEALDVRARSQELADHGFHKVEHETVRWTLDLNATQTRQLYGTYSLIARLPAAEREGILDEIERIAEVEFGDHVERRMVTPIYTAQR